MQAEPSSRIELEQGKTLITFLGATAMLIKETEAIGQPVGKGFLFRPHGTGKDFGKRQSLWERCNCESRRCSNEQGCMKVRPFIAFGGQPHSTQWRSKGSRLKKRCDVVGGGLSQRFAGM
jgi:hypothetical protein